MTATARTAKAKGRGAKPPRLLSPLFLRRLAAWAAAIVVLFNTLAPLGLPAGRTDAQSLAALNRASLCSVLGQFGRDDGAVPIGDDEHGGICVNCLPLWGALVPAPDLVAQATLRPAAPIGGEPTRAVRPAACYRPTARGPPAV